MVKISGQGGHAPALSAIQAWPGSFDRLSFSALLPGPRFKHSFVPILALVWKLHLLIGSRVRFRRPPLRTLMLLLVESLFHHLLARNQRLEPLLLFA